MDKWVRLLSGESDTPLDDEPSQWIYKVFDGYLQDKEYTDPIEVLLDFLQKFTIQNAKEQSSKIKLSYKRITGESHPKLEEIHSAIRDRCFKADRKKNEQGEALTWRKVMEKVEKLKGINKLIALLFTDLPCRTQKELDLWCGYHLGKNYIEGNTIHLFVEGCEEETVEMSEKLAKEVSDYWVEGRRLIPNAISVVPIAIRKLVGNVKHPIHELNKCFEKFHKVISEE